jgi:hypothetical protein
VQPEPSGFYSREACRAVQPSSLPLAAAIPRSAWALLHCTVARKPEEGDMAMGTHTTSRLRRTASVNGRNPVSAVRVDIVENPLRSHDPRLAMQVEEELHRALAAEDLGTVQVRFRVCRDDQDAVKFICKVENPPRVDGDGLPPSWRWWSPLLETAQDFRLSLDEGLKIRRHRLALALR